MTLVLILEDGESESLEDGEEKNKLHDIAARCASESAVRTVLLFDGKSISRVNADGQVHLKKYKSGLPSPDAVASWAANHTSSTNIKNVVVVADLKFVGFEASSIEDQYGCQIFKSLDSLIANADLQSVVYSRWATGDHIDRLRRIFRTESVLSRDNHDKDELFKEIKKYILT